MAICEHDPQHAQGKCPDMTKKEMHDFASTSEKGLPKKAKPRRKSLKQIFK